MEILSVYELVPYQRELAIFFSAHCRGNRVFFVHLPLLIRKLYETYSLSLYLNSLIKSKITVLNAGYRIGKFDGA